MPSRQGELDIIFKSYESGDIEVGKKLIKKTILDGRFPIHHLTPNLQNQIYNSLYSNYQKNKYDQEPSAASSSLEVSSKLDQVASIKEFDTKKYENELIDTVPLLFYVAMKGDLESVKLLVKQGYDILGKDSYGNNIFHYLHLNQDGNEVIKIFIYLQSKLNKVLKDGGLAKLKELLLQKNYYPNTAETDPRNQYAVSPLQLADIKIDKNLLLRNARNYNYLCCDEIRDFLGVDYDPDSNITLPGVKTNLKITSSEENYKFKETDWPIISFISAYEIEKLAANPNPHLLECLIDYGLNIKTYDLTTKYTLLHHASQINNQNSVRLLLSKLRNDRQQILKAESNKKLNGHNPLQIAVKQDDENLIKAVLSESSQDEIELVAKAKCTKGNFKGYDSLEIAIFEGNEHSAKALINIAPSVLNLKTNQNSYNSLELAIILKREDIVNHIVKYLDRQSLCNALMQKVQVSNHQYYGRGLLEIASDIDNSNIFSILLKAIPGESLAMIDGKNDVEQNIASYNLLHKLVIKNNYAIAKIFLENLNTDYLSILLSQRVDEDKSDYFGCNPLHIAIMSGNDNMFKLIILNLIKDTLYDNKARLVGERINNPLSKYAGYNSLDIASYLEQEDKIYSLLDGLTSSQCAQIMNNPNHEGLNQLHLSAIYKRDNIFKILNCHIGKKDRLNLAVRTIKNPSSKYNGHNLFHIIALNEQSHNIRILLDKFSSKSINRILTIKIKGGRYDGFNLLHIACRAKNEETLITINNYLSSKNKSKLILNRISNNSTNNQEYSAIDIAVSSGKANYVKILLSEIDDQLRLSLISDQISSRDLEGCNPLHLATEIENSQIFEELVFGHNKKKTELVYSQKAFIFQTATDGIYKDHNPFHIALKSKKIGFIDSILQLFTQEDQLEIILHQPSEGKFAGLNLIHFAAIYSDKHSIIGLLSDIGKYKEALLTTTSTQIETRGFNALHIAVKEDNLSSVEGLISLGIDMQIKTSLNNDKNLNGLTALQLAAIFSSVNSISMLAMNDNIHNIVDDPNSEYFGRSTFDIATSPYKSKEISSLLNEINLQYHISPESSPKQSFEEPSAHPSAKTFSEVARRIFNCGPGTP